MWLIKDGERGRSTYVVLTDGEVEHRLTDARDELEGLYKEVEALLGEDPEWQGLKEGFMWVSSLIGAALEVVTTYPDDQPLVDRPADTGAES